MGTTLLSSGEERRPCPACGEPILRSALKCKHCLSLVDAAGRGQPQAEPVAPAPRPQVSALGSLVPPSLAAVALLVAVMGLWLHLELLSEISDAAGAIRPEDLGGVRAAQVQWGHYLAILDGFRTAATVPVVLAVLLLPVSWGLWQRRWWARRAVLAWCACVPLLVLLNGLLVLGIEQEIRAAEADLLRSLASVARAHAPGWLVWTVSGLMTAFRYDVAGQVQQAALSPVNRHVEAALDLFLGLYLLMITPFPLLLAIVFGRTAGRSYFPGRPVPGGA